MTKVLLQYGAPAPDGTYPPVEGVLIWTPTRRRVIAGMPDKIIMPIGFKVPITGGVITVNVAPSGIDWVWRVDELVKGMSRVISYKAVPDQEEIDFTELVSVNPLSLSPLAEPEPIWYPWAEALAETTARAEQSAEDSKLAAIESQDSAQNSATAAAQSASEAATSVIQAGGHASYAGSSAFSAGTSAATALGHKNDAEEAEAGAVAAESNALLYRDQAQIARTYAEVARDETVSAKDLTLTAKDEALAARALTVETGLVDSEGHLILTRSNDEQIDAGYVIGPPINLTITDTNTSPSSEVVVGPAGPQGPKGDPGGWVTSVISVGTSLDTITTPGLYLNPNVNAAAAPSNTAGYGGHLEVIASSGWIIQRYTNIFEVRETYIRYRNSSGTWGPWYASTTARVDQTAGRVIYQWDDVNNRDQIIYGDTGWRSVTIPVKEGHTVSGTVLLRRYGAQVYMKFVDVQLAAGTGFATIFSAAEIPIGFRPISTERTMQMIGLASDALSQQFMSIYGDVIWVRRIYSTTISEIRPTTSTLSGTISWVTDNTWPTTLPGSASGSIPNT